MEASSDDVSSSSSSVSIEATGSSSSAPKKPIKKVISELFRLIGGAGTISETTHLRAAKRLVAIRDLILVEHIIPDDEDCQILRCLGISLLRRAELLLGKTSTVNARCAAGGLDQAEAAAAATEAAEAEAESETFSRDVVLVFVLLVASRAQKRKVGHLILEREGGVFETETEMETDGGHDRAWMEMSGHDPEKAADRVLEREVIRVESIQDVADLGAAAVDFFAMFEQCLNMSAIDETSIKRNDHKAGDGVEADLGLDSFLTLSSGKIEELSAVVTGGTSTLLDTIVAAADSEAGQTVLRDMYLSFCLPSSFLGRRTSILVQREIAAIATERYPEKTQLAHEAAMAGSVWLWENSSDELDLTASLLAGLACLTASGSEIRASIPFDRRVRLPFLTTPSAAPNVTQLAYIPSRNTWVVLKVARNGLQVTQSATGLEGLKLCVLALARSLCI